MADEVLTNPLLQSVDFLVLAPRSVAVNQFGWTKVASVQSMRAALTVWVDNASLPFLIRPFNTVVSGFPGVAASPLPTQLTMMEYPLLITGEWWVLCTAATNCQVIETLRIR